MKYHSPWVISLHCFISRTACHQSQASMDGERSENKCKCQLCFATETRTTPWVLGRFLEQRVRSSTWIRYKNGISFFMAKVDSSADKKSFSCTSVPKKKQIAKGLSFDICGKTHVWLAIVNVGVMVRRTRLCCAPLNYLTLTMWPVFYSHEYKQSHIFKSQPSLYSSLFLLTNTTHPRSIHIPPMESLKISHVTG